MHAGAARAQSAIDGMDPGDRADIRAAEARPSAGPGAAGRAAIVVCHSMVRRQRGQKGSGFQARRAHLPSALRHADMHCAARMQRPGGARMHGLRSCTHARCTRTLAKSHMVPHTRAQSPLTAPLPLAPPASPISTTCRSVASPRRGAPASAARRSKRVRPWAPCCCACALTACNAAWPAHSPARLKCPACCWAAVSSSPHCQDAPMTSSRPQLDVCYWADDVRDGSGDA